MDALSAGVDLAPLAGRGLVQLLDDLNYILIGHGYGEDVWNGRVCNSCNASGGGSTEPHKPDCKGVAALRDIRAVLGRP